MNTIRMTSEQYSTIKKTLLVSDYESAVFVLAGVCRNFDGVHFTVRKVITLDEKDYDHRSRYHIQVSPIFFNKTISLAEANEVTIIQCHSHPFSENRPQYSHTDDLGESISAKTVYDCLRTPMGSLLFGKNDVIGRAWVSPKKSVPIHQIRIIDRHFRIKEIGSQPISKIIDTKIYDRQIRAFGIKGQKLLSQLNIVIIGLGGTGSAVAEQLARAGIMNYLLIDHDKFEPSNKTRLYGSHANDKNIYKTDIVKRNILQIQPNARVATRRLQITTEEDLDEVKNFDIVFSCTDKHAPRSLVNNLAYQYFIPVIDIGIGLDAENDTIVGGQVRATLVSPTLPCLFCTSIINPETILAESLPKHELKVRLNAGYIKGLENDVPSLVEVTSMAGSFGMLLLKDLLYGVVYTQANTISLDIPTFQSSRLTTSVKPNCVCLSRLGKGTNVNRR